jgi:capsular polysaccharide transport system permease protein
MTDVSRGLSLPAQDATPGGRLRRAMGAVSKSFLFIVVLPTLLTAIYFLLASPQYVSEARFVVRSHTQNGPAAFGTVLQSVGMDLGGSSTNAYEVHEYIMSRDAVTDLERSHRLRAKLAAPGADALARFPRPFAGRGFEDLYRAYKRFVTVGYDSTTGISTLRVQAFRAQDAHDIAKALLDGGEELVNRLNQRSAADTIEQARLQVIDAETRTSQAQAALTRFRSREQLIDPGRSSLAGSELLARLDLQIANLRADRASLAASAPQSADLPAIDRRIKAYQAQREAESSKIAGESDSLAPKIGAYEQLALERDFAQRSLAAANAALESAHVEARRKQLYLERVVSPNIPDRAARPRRLLSILMVFVTCMAAYGTVTLVIAGLREHKQV